MVAPHKKIEISKALNLFVFSAQAKIRSFGFAKAGPVKPI
jgi:hypothetical protein